MSDSRRTSFLKSKILTRYSLEAIALSVLRSFPLIGPQIELITRISALFQDDDAIQADFSKIMKHMTEIEDIVPRLKIHLEDRRADLENAFKEYERFKSLAEVEKGNAQPLLKEFHQIERRNLILAFFSGLILIFIGIVLSHYLRIWMPGFTF